MIKSNLINRTAIYVLALSISCILHFPVIAQDRISLSQDLQIENLGDGAYLVTHTFPWACNSLLVQVSESTAVLADTPCENEATKLLVEWIRETLNAENIIAINTGFHVDNLGGNKFLLDHNIPVYGSDLTAQLVTEKAQSMKKELLDETKSLPNQKYYQVYKNIDFKSPNKLFKINEGLILDFPNETIEIFYPGPSHILDNTVVYFTKRKILFGGCMVKSFQANNPGNTADADMQQWPRSVEKVRYKYNQAKIVVPGHGRWGDIKLLNHTIQLLDRHNQQHN